MKAVTAPDISHVEAVMGTTVSYLVEPGALSAGLVAAALLDSTAELHRLDEMFSTWKPESPMSRLRRGELQLAGMPTEVDTVLRLSALAKDMTEGFFDPWAMPGGVDPTGLVKGWAIERATAILRSHGVMSAIVNGGGDIAGFGASRRVGIRHPWRQDALAAVVTLSDGIAIATSGTYERGDHLVNPLALESGSRPRETVVSASVTGPALALADAAATALAVAGHDGDRVALRLERLGYESYRIYDDGTEVSSGGFPFADGGETPWDS